MVRVNFAATCMVVLSLVFSAHAAIPLVAPKQEGAVNAARGVAGADAPVFATDGTRLITADMAAQYLPAMSLDVDCPVDIEFVLDSSGSMASRWVALKAAVVDITNFINFDAGADGARVGVVTYDGTAYQDIVLGTHPNTAAGLTALQAAISALALRGGGTATNLGIDKGQSDFVANPAAPVGSRARIMIIITDGVPNSRAAAAASALLAKGAVPSTFIYALGLGTGADSANLNQMASPGTCPAARDCNVNAGLPEYGVPPLPFPFTEAGYCPLCPQSYAIVDAATIQILAQNIANAACGGGGGTIDTIQE